MANSLTQRKAKERAKDWMSQAGYDPTMYYARVCSRDEGFRRVFIIKRGSHTLAHLAVAIKIPADDPIEIDFRRPQTPP